MMNKIMITKIEEKHYTQTIVREYVRNTSDENAMDLCLILEEKPMSKKKLLLVNDYVIWENICNLKCKYCKEEKVTWKRKGDILYIGNSSIKVSDIIKKVNTILEKVNMIIDTPILKVSGGEITIIPEILEWINQIKDKYEIIQILTNNYLTPENLYEKIIRMGNIHLQISLDGHTYEMNRYRFANKKQFEKVIENFKTLMAYPNIPVEINCVLSDINYLTLLNYLEWIMNFDRDNLIVNIFPVRGVKGVKVPMEAVNSLKNILINYRYYSKILPPYPYIQSLYNFIKYQEKISCLIPYAVIGTYDTGNINLCTCSPTLPNLGNVLKNKLMEITDKIYNPAFYKPLQTNPPKYKACKECFIHYDIINLYFKNRITENDLKHMPFYSGTKTIQRLKYIKKIIKGGM